MDSMYSSVPGSSKATSESVFDSLDEILDEGESGCPAFDRLIQRAENENSELVRLLEVETRKQIALQKELEDTHSQKEILERSSKSLKEEEKQLQRLAKQNKEISESLKRTNALLQQHEGTLQKKYEKACSDLQKLQLDNTEVVDKYKGTWDRYYAFYEKSKLAVDLANTKRTALEKQKQANDMEKKVKEMEVQLVNKEKEKKNIEEKLRNGPKSSRASIVKLAELYIQASNTIKLGNEKFAQLQKKQTKEGNQENAVVTSAYADPEEQELEHETDNTDQLGLQRKESPRVISVASAHENSSHQLQHTIVNIDPEKPPPLHHVHSFHGRNQENCRNIAQPMQKNLSPKQDSIMKEGPFQSKSPAFHMLSQKKLLNRPMDSPGPTAATTKGLANYGRFLSSYSPINTTYTFQTSLSPARAPQYQLFNSSSKTPCTSQQSQNWVKDSYSKTINNEVQVGLEKSPGLMDKTHVEKAQLTSQECQEQMVEDIPSALNTTVKSPGRNINQVSPKNPNMEPECSDVFNFTEYNERIKLMNKSPGEGFAYRSRPMFDMVENMNEDNERYEHLPKQSFFQPFFSTRENEPHEQFVAKPTFFTMSPQNNQENTVQQGHQFHIERDQTSIPNSNNLFSSLTPGEGCATSPAVGFSLFSDQPAANAGRHGNQSPQSPAFAFNFCNSPSLPSENSSNNTGTFNLF